MLLKTIHRKKSEGFAAITLAPRANNGASEARRNRDEAKIEKEWIEFFDQFWAESNLSLHTLACLLATLCSLILGWSVYDGFISDLFFSGLEHAPWYAVVGVSGFLTSFALYTSTLAAKVFNPKYREWLLVTDEMTGGQPEISQYNQSEQFAKDQLKFALALTFTLSIIIFISLQRYAYLVEEKGKSSAWDFTLILMPIVSYICEIITGEMAMLWLRRTTRYNRMQTRYDTFKTLQSRTAELDKQIFQQWQTAEQEQRPFLMVGDVTTALFRAEKRSIDNDNYVDEIPESANSIRPNLPALSNQPTFNNYEKHA